MKTFDELTESEITSLRIQLEMVGSLAGIRDLFSGNYYKDDEEGICNRLDELRDKVCEQQGIDDPNSDYRWASNVIRESYDVTVKNANVEYLRGEGWF